MRYVLSANAPETKDNDFTWKDFQARNNNELLAIFGNFINRALVLTDKYYGGTVPQRGELTEFDQEVLRKMQEFPMLISNAIESYRFREALSLVMDLARLGNKYLADSEPWKVIKTDANRVKTILNISLQIVASLAVVAEPFLPFTSVKIKNMLGVGALNWHDAGKEDMLKAAHQLNAPALLFEKIEDTVVAQQVKKLSDTKMENELANKPVVPSKEEITFDDFSKMDIRLGTILEAEKVAKSKKLLKLKVDTGIDTRTVVSGIAEHFEPQNIIGKQVTMLVNLAPRQIMGIESKGMILMAEDKDGKLNFLHTENKVANGSTVS